MKHKWDTWKGRYCMEAFRAVNFAVFPHRGVLGSEESRNSMEEMVRRIHTNWVIFTPSGMQETPYSEEIRYDGEKSCTDEELYDMIRYAQSLGLKVALKPTVNCDNGVWRARISFFDHDVPCEPKWRNWFESHIAFQKHYAQIAQRTGCELFLAGCEMTMTEHRETEWRKLIAEVRTVYDGPVGYNCDKYGEDHITWWDAVDVIASSGYYPIDDWDNQLDRIEKVVKKFQKPFLFSEAGCMNIHGSAQVPNNWELQGEEDDAEQADWYRAMFTACRKRDWVKGFGIWDWPGNLEGLSPYAVCGRPAENVIAEEYGRRE